MAVADGHPRNDPARRFMRRGLDACQAEWKLLCGTHNLLKLRRRMVMRPAATPATALLRRCDWLRAARLSV
jgi:hypothetical protein